MEARLGVFLLLLVTVLQAVAGVSFHGEVADKIPKVVEEQKNGQQCKGVCFYGEAADWILKVIEEQKNAQQCKDNQKVPDHRPTECKDIKSQRGNGIYDVYPKFSTGFKVYCDMETDHGGWTVFQRRIDGKTDFYRDWEAYENGFGNLEAEFWLGNRKLHKLTSQGKYELRVEMSDFDGNKLVAKYSSFFIGNATTKYKLKVGGYSGNAGDSMTYCNGMSFSTKDRDNDKWSRKCAVHRYGAWWYNGCTYANLNGQYLKGGKQSAKGLYWWKWKTTHYSMKSTVMMLRKLN